MPKYTKDWLTEFKRNTFNIRNLDLCLEIGSFEGATSNYICDKLLNNDGKLICVDPLTDNYLNDNLSENDKRNNETVYAYFNKQYDRFINNTKHNSQKIELYRKLSSEAYAELKLKYYGKIDFIYIDGDHRAEAVYLDAINCFDLLKPNGYMLFDDYGEWSNLYPEKEKTYAGIDKFLEEYDKCYSMIIKNYQVLIQKKEK